MNNVINKLVKVVGGILLLAILVFSAYSYFSIGKVDDKVEVDDKEDIFNENNIAEAKIIDGKQIAQLSWGKFNYNPNIIKVKVGIPVQIVADMDRLQGCFRSVIIPELGISKNLNENDNIVEFTPEKKGTFNFGCAMGMGSGELVVE